MSRYHNPNKATTCSIQIMYFHRFVAPIDINDTLKEMAFKKVGLLIPDNIISFDTDLSLFGGRVPHIGEELFILSPPPYGVDQTFRVKKVQHIGASTKDNKLLTDPQDPLYQRLFGTNGEERDTTYTIVLEVVSIGDYEGYDAFGEAIISGECNRRFRAVSLGIQAEQIALSKEGVGIGLLSPPFEEKLLELKAVLQSEHELMKSEKDTLFKKEYLQELKQAKAKTDQLLEEYKGQSTIVPDEIGELKLADLLDESGDIVKALKKEGYVYLYDIAKSNPSQLLKVGGIDREDVTLLEQLLDSYDIRMSG